MNPGPPANTFFLVAKVCRRYTVYMGKCANCDSHIPNRVKIGGVTKNLSSRKFCLKCSPFGENNRLAKLDAHGHSKRCQCGETNPKRFYPHRRTECRRCHSRRVNDNGRARRKEALAHLGNKCVRCGFSEFPVAIDIHHLNPSIKDPSFERMRGWSWKRLVKELSHCILLCRNCHAAVHAGVAVI